LFAGTGAVGIEALSRGAASVRFSDMNKAPIEIIKFNVGHCGFMPQSEIRRADAFAYLAAQPDRKFEYVYIAPPQYKEMWVKALELLDENIGWLADDGWVIVQIAPREYRTSNPTLNILEEFEQRQYGNTLLVFYQRKLP
jgi:16S rRNA (guanine(966)-N(2))-methyltransferase RsmD